MTVENVRKWRLSIDSFINSCGCLRPSRELSLTKTNLELSKMWLGMILKDLGTPNPYPESMNPDSKVIEPMAEHTKDTIFPADIKADEDIPLFVGRIKFFRGEVEKVIVELKENATQVFLPENRIVIAPIANDQAYIALVEAKLWLGMILNAVREQVK